MSSIVGLNGLKPTLEIIKYTKNKAIANKESIICGWNLLKEKSENTKLNLYLLTQNTFLYGMGLKKY